MRNVIYCRVSNLKVESQSFATQEKNCTEYCKKNNMRIKEVYKEHNSGYGKQKTLENILLRNKNINVIINDITRFSRSNVYGLKLLQLCLKKGIKLHFVKEEITYDGENNFHLIQAGLANSEHEWTTIRNNIIANIKHRKAMGLCLGNAPFGFDIVDKKLVKNQNFNAVRLIISLRNGVKKCNEIRKILSKLSTESELLKFYEKSYENYIEKEKRKFERCTRFECPCGVEYVITIYYDRPSYQQLQHSPYNVGQFKESTKYCVNCGKRFSVAFGEIVRIESSVGTFFDKFTGDFLNDKIE
jgi:DNA invertase Pin-like site-specific DNA recombinase